MAQTESQRRAAEKWTQANARKMMFKFYVKSDADVIAQLDKQDNRTDYVRQLVRADIARQAQEDPEE